MIELIQSLLGKLPSLSAWIITAEEKRTAEVFLIKDKVDMNRACDTLEYSIKLFVDFEENGKRYKGDATAVVGASDSAKEIEEKLQKTALAAGFVKNPWYDLPENEDIAVLKPKAYPLLSDFKAKFEEIHRILYKPYPYQSKVNSCELFASESKLHVRSSKGVDVGYERSLFSFEVVTDSEQGAEPVEIFNGYELSNIDLAEIERIVDKQLMETEGRALATRNIKMENMRVVLSGDAVEELLYFYWEQASARTIYQQVSRAKIGDNFFGKDAVENFNMRINPALKNAVNPAPVDGEGKKLQAYTLYENGVVKNLLGNAKFAQYLHVANRGYCNIFEVDGGKQSLSAYLQGEYVEILAFSSFLMDETTGDFGGEFRLAKHIKDGVARYITGGSISENLFRLQDSMRLSKELQARKHSLAPAAVILDGVTVAGE